jgi:hypothetical protein
LVVWKELQVQMQQKNVGLMG